MIKITKFCDVCNKESDDMYTLEMKWCNSNKNQRFDICKECKDNGNEFITPEEEHHFISGDPLADIRFLKTLRVIFKKIKKVGD